MLTLRIPRKVFPILTTLIIFSIVALTLFACTLDGNGNNNDGNTGDDDDGPDGVSQFLVLVPEGPFLQGSDPSDPDADGDEMVTHPVVLDEFKIFGTEVTNAEYQECVNAGECEPPQDAGEPDSHYGDPDYAKHPVVYVNWYQASAFCEFADDGRLPTEAEWEKAARGTEEWPYPWGFEAPDCERTNSIFCEDGLTHPVGTHPMGDTLLGVKDMAGNVMEWTLDYYHPEYYLNVAYVNPTGPRSGKLISVRGGSFDSGSPDLRTTARMGLLPDEANEFLGFRCVPQGITRTPFCLTNYVPSCIPRKPGGDDDDSSTTINYCDPEVSILSLSCPKNGIIQVTVETGLPSAHGFSLSVNGVNCNCTPFPENPSRLNCSCTYVGDSNVYADFEVCKEGGGSQQIFNELFSPELVSLAFSGSADQQVGLQGPYTRSAVTLGGGGTDYFCEKGYEYIDGLCVKIPNGSGCPEGTHQTETPYGGGCAPDEGGQCPNDWTYVEYKGTCEPNEGSCPAGYAFDTQINCCAPIDPNNPCGDEGYYDYFTNECLPKTDDGCKEGEALNKDGCGPDLIGDYYGGINGETNGYGPPGQGELGYCPPGSAYLTEFNCCVPLPGLDTVACPDGAEPDKYGKCPEPDGDPDCDEGMYLHEVEEGYYYCLPLDEHGCKLDENWGEKSQECKPAEPNGIVFCPLGYEYIAGVGCVEICEGDCWDFIVTVPKCTVDTSCPRNQIWNSNLQKCVDDPGGSGSSCSASPPSCIGLNQACCSVGGCFWDVFKGMCY